MFISTMNFCISHSIYDDIPFDKVSAQIEVNSIVDAIEHLEEFPELGSSMRNEGLDHQGYRIYLSYRAYTM